MKKITLGDIIVQNRTKLKLTRERLAKKLKITSGYLGLLENDSHSAHFSDRLAGDLSEILHVKKSILDKLAIGHNRRKTAYRKKLGY
jgi:transcriptional regulator with XRE-family HTH domain